MVLVTAAADEPPDSGVVERTRSSLALLDMTVTGPPEAVASLTAEDFKIRVNLTRIRDFRLDRHCPVGSGDDVPGAGPSRTDAALTVVPVRYVLYFDQRQLTLPGRQQSIDLARRLVPLLVGGDNEAMIVSSAERIAVIERFTSDPNSLLDGLERLEHDREQWDAWSTQEPDRLARVVRILNDEDNLHRAIAAARGYAREERWRTDRDLRRLAVALAWLGDVAPPKVVLYFADTVRSNAGEHYLTFFGESLQRKHPLLSGIGTDSLMAGLPFDAVVNEASSQGIRFYPVLGQGLATIQDHAYPTAWSLERTRQVPQSSIVRARDVEGTLDSMASETGGAAFFHGETAWAIARKIQTDFSCLYVASFDPSRFGEDAPLRVVAEARVPGVRVHSRGRMVVRSEEATRTARLLGAFSLSDDGDTVAVRMSLVPTGYSDGRYSALLQVSVPGSAIPSTAWDIGASVVLRDRVVEQASGRLQVSRPGVPLVLEEELQLEPGSYELVAVAHERASDLIFSEQADLEWPDPDRGEASLVPVTVLQPTPGAFFRQGDTRTSGSLAQLATDAIDRDLPTAFVGLVCRGRKHRATLVVERTLVGDSRVDFPPVVFDLGEERCAQLRDLVPANVLTSGRYRYEVRVLEDGRAVSSTARELVVRDAPGAVRGTHPG